MKENWREVESMQDGPDPAPASPAETAEALVICPLRRRRGLLLVGEADTNSRRALHDALADMPAGGPGPYDFHLELAGLRFIDVSCTREIIVAAERHPAARLVLHHPPSALRRVAALLRPEGTSWTDGGSA
jgi:STAS domain